MTIAILDQENSRVIVAEVPQYLTDQDASSDQIAQAILVALGLPDYTDYMIGTLNLGIDVDTLNSGKGYGENSRRISEYSSNFKEEVLAALEEVKK